MAFGEGIVLERLQVRNLALIESLDLEFAPGLNLITGETGSGKSILLDALGFALGSRVGTEIIRGQAELAQVSAVFVPPAAWLRRWRPWFDEKGLPFDEGQLLCRRELSRSGRGRAWINGEPCNIGVLAELGLGLVDFHGQHEHQSLLRVSEHIEYLDRFGRLETERAAVSAAWDSVQARRAALEGPDGRPEERQRRLEFLEFQLAELADLAPKAGEIEGLRATVRLQASAGRRAELAAQALRKLDGEEGGGLLAVGEAAAALRRLAELDPSKAALAEQVARGLTELEDAASRLRREAASLELDPAELERLQVRLHAWEQACRRHRCAEDELPEVWQKLKAEAAALRAREEDEEALRSALEAARRAYAEAASVLSRARQKAAASMVKAMTRELQALVSPNALFTIRMDLREDPEGAFEVHGRRCRGDRLGVDVVEFLFAPNLGEAPKPLARIASGGELSRVTLALKSVYSSQEGEPCLVFDEIDAGISGRVAALVGAKIAELAKRHQVLCITHLPQIACLPARHVRVMKMVVKGQTQTRAEVLDEAGRRLELAALIAGDGQPGESALLHAQELLSAGGAAA
jgi:DNA repair protein RecN (Recombination protein N)